MAFLFDAWRMAHGAWREERQLAVPPALCALRAIPEVRP